MQPGHQPLGPVSNRGGLAHRQDRAQHLLQRARIQGEHLGVAAQVPQGRLDLPGWEGADGAQVLGQDQVGLQFRQRLLVQGVQAAVGGEPAVDVLVDLPGRHPTGVQSAGNHGLVHPGGRGLVALERHTGELVAQSQRVHDLRRRRQQRH